MNKMQAIRSDVSDEAVEIPVAAYISPDYARAERTHLWDKVWQVACREEELPNVGDYVTYDILENSAIIVRTGPDEIVAYTNTCRHRGRRLTDGCGHAEKFACKYHAWQWNLKGENIHVSEKQDWSAALTDEKLRLGRVKVGRWAGYVYVNFDPGCEPFEQFLGTLPHWIDPFEMGKMRYKWRRWTIIPCNWKAMLEAFIETYHASIIHPQNRKFSSGRGWNRSEGMHTAIGTAGREGGGGLTASVDPARAKDHRQTVLAATTNLHETVEALTTDTFVAAAKKLFDVLPETASAAEVSNTLMNMAREMDQARGVIWADVSAEHMRDTGFNWHVFPNSLIEPGVSCGLGMRVRPNGYDPDSCILDAHALERFPEGEVPKVENVHLPKEQWPLLWLQDFENLPDVQRGMKCSGDQAVRPNPVVEKAIINLHRGLGKYMGAGAPRPMAQS